MVSFPPLLYLIIYWIIVRFSLLLAILVNSLAELSDDVGGILSAKDGRTRNDDVGASLSSLINSTQSQATIHLDVEVRVFLAQSFDLGQLGSHELLTTESGVNGHNQDHLIVAKRDSVSMLLRTP